MINVCLQRSPRKGKAYRAIFTRTKDFEISYTDFGSNYSNYTEHKNDIRKHRFLTRFHRLIEKDKNNYRATFPITR